MYYDDTVDKMSSIKAGLLKLIRGQIKCEKFVKYQGRTLEINGISGEVTPIKVNLEGLTTQLTKLSDAADFSKQIDDFQYTMCLLAKELGRDNPEYIKFWKIRAAGIILVNSFGFNLLAFEKDPIQFKTKLDNCIDDMQKFVKKVVFQDMLGTDAMITSRDTVDVSPTKAIFWMKPMTYTPGQPAPLYRNSVFTKGWTEDTDKQDSRMEFKTDFDIEKKPKTVTKRKEKPSEKVDAGHPPRDLQEMKTLISSVKTLPERHIFLRDKEVEDALLIAGLSHTDFNV